jgi:hypothetical protein
MSRTETILHNGKPIYYMDFSSLKSESEIESLITESKSFIRSKPPKSVYSLTNIEDMHFNGTIKELFVDFVKGNKVYIKASAIIGVTGMKQILFNGIMRLTGRDIRSFDSADQAKNWLISHN